MYTYAAPGIDMAFIVRACMVAKEHHEFPRDRIHRPCDLAGGLAHACPGASCYYAFINHWVAHYSPSNSYTCLYMSVKGVLPVEPQQSTNLSNYSNSVSPRIWAP